MNQSDPEDFGIDTQTGKWIKPIPNLPSVAESGTISWDIRHTSRGFFAVQSGRAWNFQAGTFSGLKRKLSAYCGKGNVVYK